MKSKILLSMLAIVLVAGCSGIPGMENLGTGAIGGGRGLEITSFTAEPSPIYSQSKIRIMMEVENLGGTTTRDATSLVYLTGSNVDLTSSNELYWRSSTDTEFKSFAKDMKAADVVKGTTGDTKRFTWSLTAPSVPAGQTRTDTFYGRTYCDYSTGVNGNVWVYTEAEADAAKASGRSTNRALFTSTSGPVALSVSVSPDPVILYEGGETTFSLDITVSNLATGTIYRSGKSYSGGISLVADDYNKVDIVLNYDSSDLSIVDAEGCTGEQELVAGKSTTLVCDMNILDSVDTFKSFPITVTANYGYYTERSATVIVQGK